MGAVSLAPTIAVEPVEALSSADLEELCDAAESAIAGGGGFGWINMPTREIMQAFWRGALVVPERRLFLARIDGVVAGSAQLVRPPPSNEAQSFAAHVRSAFVAPWARGHGLARLLVRRVEEVARESGFHTLLLDIRETQLAAIQLYEAQGYVRWGTNPRYARVDGRILAGYHYYKDLHEDGGEGAS